MIAGLLSVAEDVLCKGDGSILLFGELGRRVSASVNVTMQRSWNAHQIDLTITTVMGTSFKVRMTPQETILDIKRRIYYREGR